MPTSPWSRREVFGARPRLPLFTAAATALVVCLILALRSEHPNVASANSLQVATAVQPEGPAEHPERVMGAKTCAQCHESEHAAWQQTQHQHSLDRLRAYSGNVKQYAAALLVSPSRLRKDSQCTACHATVQATETGDLRAISGVSCESCHGASGGSDGWLNRHGSAAANEHPAPAAGMMQDRLEFCERAGMVRPHRMYAMAKRCLSCHVVDDERLVNAGHSAGSQAFEMVSWSTGEIRHNFHEDPAVNASAATLCMQQEQATAAEHNRVRFVVGTLADLEVSLRRRASAQTATYASQIGTRISALVERVSQIHDRVARPEIAATLTLTQPLRPRLLSPPQANDAELFNQAAAAAAKAAQALADTCPGSQLAPLDALISAHASRGTPFQP